MRLEITKDFDTGEMRFTGSLTREDLQNMKLDDFDKMLLTECEAPGATPADKLMALELMFRRAQEAQTS